MKQFFQNVGWSILEYLRRALTPFVIDLLYGMTMLAVSAIGIEELAIALTVALLGVMLFTNFVFMRSAGEIAYKMKLTGAARRQGMPVNADKSLGTYREAKEYRPYKGFCVGVLIGVIPLVLILTAALAGSAGSRMALVFVAGWAYLPVFVIATVGSADGSVAAITLLWGLIILAVNVVVCGIAYITGGAKERANRAMLDKRSEVIEEQKRAREAAIEAQRARNKAALAQKKSRGGEKKR